MRSIVAAAILTFVMVIGIDPQSALARDKVRGMAAFQTYAEFKAFMDKKQGNINQPSSVVLPSPPPPPQSSMPPAPASSSPKPAKGEIIVTAQKIDQKFQNVSVAVSAVSGENITNRQEADVDEGGIVKVHGEHLVVLRRGRLFTISLADKTMRQIAHIDAFPPGDNGGAWYDEMLIVGDRIVVIGYNYNRGGTEINRFTIGRSGSLRYDDTHHLTSNDYYSESNYASRLIGSRLIFDTPLSLRNDDVLDDLPGVRRWQGDAEEKFRRITLASSIYAPEPVLRRKDAVVDTLHSVTTCDLAAAILKCSATAVLGSRARTFYVSATAVYIWIADAFENETDADQGLSMVYRLPLKGGRPSAIMTWGGPIDQFSFREDRRRSALNIVVRADTGGDSMWQPVVSDGDIALLHLPLNQFGDGSGAAAISYYRALPRTKGNDWSFHNRFVGDHLIYSGGTLQQREMATGVFVVPVEGGAIKTVNVTHGVDRIEALGNDALAVGGGDDSWLGFTSIELNKRPRLGDSYRLPAASEGESRSHAFFFRPDTADGASGLLGLPVSRHLDTDYRRFLGDGSAIVFLGRKDRRFSAKGELTAHPDQASDDACVASCVDWYGNARPIFLGTRLFALMGYELVEGSVKRGHISEKQRVSFAPKRDEKR